MDDNDLNAIKSDFPAISSEMCKLLKELYPICRSITGNGVRKTLEIIQNYILIEHHEVPSGTKVFDWIIPKEWNIEDAYIKTDKGQKIVDFQKSNLHVLNYSTPIKSKLSLSELKQHLYTLPDQPEAIPYKTSYYNENWGFCLSHNQFLTLEDGKYEIVIDSSLKDGNLTYGEFFLQGKKNEEILLTCYTCHPSLCNDNLSGIVLLTFLAQYLSKLKLDYSYRFLFIPETIGAITWLKLNEEKISKIKHGLVITCVGDSGKFTYKKSRLGNTEIDQTAINILKESGESFQIKDFFPVGSDERQFCSPGFNLPMGSLMRTMYHKFPEYHTSLDNLEFVKGEYLIESFSIYLKIILELEKNFGKFKPEEKLEDQRNIDDNDIFMNLNPKCEPNLEKRGLFNKVVHLDSGTALSINWVLNLSDGRNSLSDISRISGIEYNLIKETSELLLKHNLLKKIT